MMYALDLPRSQFELCRTCASDIEVPTNPPPRIFSRQLLGYLFEVRLDEVDYYKLVDLKAAIIAQLHGADRNSDIIRKIDSMFPVVKVQEPVTLSPMFLRLVRDRIIILLNAIARRRYRRQAEEEAERATHISITRSLVNILNIVPIVLNMMKQWMFNIFDGPTTELTSEWEYSDDSDAEMSE